MIHIFFIRNKLSKSFSFSHGSFSTLLIEFEPELLTNPGKLSLAEGTARSVITYQEPKDQPD